MRQPWRFSPLTWAACALGREVAKVAFVTIATDDYYAQGALVTLHSVAMHTRRASLSSSYVLMVAPPGISPLWRGRFAGLGVRLVDVPSVAPSRAVGALMEADRQQLATQSLLEVLQPVPYGGAFAKIHAWDPDIFGEYDKVVLLDGDIVAKKPLFGLLDHAPIGAAEDLMDAFNYGVVVLRPDRSIHEGLKWVLSNSSNDEIALYNTRQSHQVGFGDQALVTGYLAKHHGPIHFFEDTGGQRLLSTKYNFVVSYRAQERCERKQERKLIDAAALVHFANNWLHFTALVDDRDSPGRIDSPRCYQGVFRYWRDMFDHAMASINVSSAALLPLPKYKPATAGDELGAQERVQRNFVSFLTAGPHAAKSSASMTSSMQAEL